MATAQEEALPATEAEAWDVLEQRLRLSDPHSHPRGRLLLRMGQGVRRLCWRLAQELHSHEQGHGSEDDRALRVLAIVSRLGVDRDFIEEFAYHGGLTSMQRLMVSSNEDVVQAACEVASLVAQQGVAQTPRMMWKEEISREFDPLAYLFAIDDGHMRVLLRKVSQQQQSQFTVGYMMWSAAVILSRIICRNHEILKLESSSILELGAGLGLCGIVSSKWASRVCLTDFNPEVLHNLVHNATLNYSCETVVDHGIVRPVSSNEGNIGTPHAEFADAPASAKTTVDVRFFDWDTGSSGDTSVSAHAPAGFQALNYEDRFDVILASDVVCQVMDAHGVARAVQHFLKPRGCALIVLPFPQHRYGVEAMEEALELQDLHFQVCEVNDAELLVDIEEAEYFRWRIFRIWRESVDDLMTRVM